MVALRAISGEGKKPEARSVAANPFTAKRLARETGLGADAFDRCTPAGLTGKEERALRMGRGVTVSPESALGKKELPPPTALGGGLRTFDVTMLARIEARALEQVTGKKPAGNKAASNE